jgi:hypothetical protein
MEFKVGDVVEVKSPEEILATLDGQASLDELPFMPEMMKFAGKQFTVSKRADKTCDTIGESRTRRMHSAVHLDDLRCDGSAHGGCQADCLLFWKESWLRRVDSAGADGQQAQAQATIGPSQTTVRTQVLLKLDAGTRAVDAEDEGGVRYRCQATEIQRATTPMSWLDPRQYARDVRSGNVSFGHAVKVLLGAFPQRVKRIRKKPLPGSINSRGRARVVLGLAAGDLVRVKSLEEISETLDLNSRNRGLYYDWEMKPFSGGTYRVKRRVERLIDEKTGRMLTIPGGDCLILDGVVCRGDLSRYRRFCPRAYPPFWREAWLERADSVSTSEGEASVAPSSRAGAQRGSNDGEPLSGDQPMRPPLGER